MISDGKKAQAFKLTLIVLLIAIGAAIFIYILFMPLFPTAPWIRRLRVKQYSNDSDYSVLSGQAQVRYFENEEMYVEITAEDYTHCYQFIKSNRKIIEDNGFNEILGDAAEDEYGNTFYEVNGQVTITVREGIWGDGMQPFAVGLSVDDKEYLSYETGKANLLYYIEYEMY